MQELLSKAIRVGCASPILLLAGCGANVYSYVPVGTLAVPPAIANGIYTTTNFGDSITCGYGASTPDHDYANLLDAAIGKPATNLCRYGDQAADMGRWYVYPDASPALGAHQLYTVLIGVNDAIACGGSSACVANWHNSLEASLAWMALPAEDKKAASEASSRTGTWIADLTNGLATTDGGASLNFTVNQTVANHQLYVAYRVFDSSSTNPGLATLSVDNVPLATLSAAVTTGHLLKTQNGTSDTIWVTSVPLGGLGSHSVRVTTTGTGGALFSLLWVGASSGNYSGNPAAPRVLVGTVTTTSTASVNQAIAAYNTALPVLVASLTAEGMQIGIAPASRAIDPAVDLLDGLHPNDAGYLKLAVAFAGALAP